MCDTNNDKNHSNPDDDDNNKKPKKKKPSSSASILKPKQIASRTRHRLYSIYHDSTLLQSHPWFPSSSSFSSSSVVVVANERCGSWYIRPFIICHPPSPASSSSFKDDDHEEHSRSKPLKKCYFKSTDGHVHFFSWKRLNLHLLLDFTTTKVKTTIIVDSSSRKPYPDSFSRTIPIWCCVLNRYIKKLLVLKSTTSTILEEEEEEETATTTIDDEAAVTQKFWDFDLYTPRSCVSQEEHSKIESIIDTHVAELLECGAIVNPTGLIVNMTKPLRPYWIRRINDNGDIEIEDGISSSSSTVVVTTANDNATSSISTTTATIDDYFHQHINNNFDKFKPIICWNPSCIEDRYKLKEQRTRMTTATNTPPPPPPPQDNKDVEKADDDNDDDYDYDDDQQDTSSFYYTSGAADDEESWSRHLTPEIFWKYVAKNKSLFSQLENNNNNNNNKRNENSGDNDIDDLFNKAIDRIVQQDKENDDDEVTNTTNSETTMNNSSLQYADQIGNLNVWVGSRRAGKPLYCWDHFDAIINVTTTDYDDIITSMEDKSCKKFYYLKLPVEEGKRDKTELERWLSVGLLFLIQHLHHQDRRKVLVHCAQGKDRSVAVVLAYIVLMCGRDNSNNQLQYPLSMTKRTVNLQALEQLCRNPDTATRNDVENSDCNACDDKYYLKSGLSKYIVDVLLQADNNNNNDDRHDDSGATVFLKWIHTELQQPIGTPLANKERIRIGLQLLRQDRQVADPTRSTLQKLNRFFMSNPMYR